MSNHSELRFTGYRPNTLQAVPASPVALFRSNRAPHSLTHSQFQFPFRNVVRVITSGADPRLKFPIPPLRRVRVRLPPPSVGARSDLAAFCGANRRSEKEGRWFDARERCNVSAAGGQLTDWGTVGRMWNFIARSSRYRE